MINHPNRGRNPILDVVNRSPIGKRHQITRQEMADLLNVLQVQQLVDLNNGWCGIPHMTVDAAGQPQPTEPPAAELAAAWAKMCRGIQVISVLADSDPVAARLASSNPGAIRYDDPGSMHPQLRATLMFAPAEMADHPYDQIGQLRRKARRVLVVSD